MTTWKERTSSHGMSNSPTVPVSLSTCSSGSFRRAIVGDSGMDSSDAVLLLRDTAVGEDRPVVLGTRLGLMT